MRLSWSNMFGNSKNNLSLSCFIASKMKTKSYCKNKSRKKCFKFTWHIYTNQMLTNTNLYQGINFSKFVHVIHSSFFFISYLGHIILCYLPSELRITWLTFWESWLTFWVLHFGILFWFYRVSSLFSGLDQLTHSSL